MLAFFIGRLGFAGTGAKRRASGAPRAQLGGHAKQKWKAVIGGETGGITVQLIPGVTGFAVNSPEGTAFSTWRLLNEPELMAVLGRQGKE